MITYIHILSIIHNDPNCEIFNSQINIRTRMIAHCGETLLSNEYHDRGNYGFDSFGAGLDMFMVGKTIQEIMELSANSPQCVSKK